MNDSSQSPLGKVRLPAPACLERHRELIVPAMRAAVERLAPSIRGAVAYHLGWQDASGNEVTSHGGKAIRPAIVLLAAEAIGAPAEHALPGAVALELVHNFSLLHDDVMDGDEERRHRPTVWAVFGVGQAIVAGDALLALSQELLLESDGPHRLLAVAELSRATAEMIRGQCDDLAFEARIDMTIDEGVRMCLRKTGALLGCAGALGAILAGGDGQQVATLRTFGRELGLAFQAVDDLLGIWGDPAVTGKPAASDLRRRKKTLPVLHALRLSSVAAERELTSLLSEGELADRPLARAVELLEAAGSRGWTQRFAERHLERALARLEGCRLKPAAADDLRDVALFITGRDF